MPDKRVCCKKQIHSIDLFEHKHSQDIAVEQDQLWDL